MSEKRINEILNHYWAGESSLEEEVVLKQYFAQGELPAEHERYRALFSFYAKEEKRQMRGGEVREFVSSEVQQPISPSFEKPQDRSRSLTHSSLFFLAAAFALLISLSIFLMPQPQDPNHISLTADTFEDPEEAYQEARKALLLVSARLNSGRKFQQELRPIRRVSEMLYSNKKQTP